jgi:predicted dienelactone hydrolase
MSAPELQTEMARANGDHSIAGIGAAFAIAPANVQAFEPASFAKIKIPVAILLGDADSVAPPDTNGRLAAGAIPGAKLTVLPGIGHYDFLSTCTPAATISEPLCQGVGAQDRAHETALSNVNAFFVRHLGTP